VRAHDRPGPIARAGAALFKNVIVST